ncbi:hypothetical protein GGH91_000201 [Coemansia sp. RSA 2671]|nr:hypothetical protein LPJ60_000368 [Coemansia sp. RSA 2675]KAJ2350343.1 hypothetical protein GGH91_000201 [Coemansia sp. RSA 2671]
MLSRLGIRVGDTVAIYSTPNIDMLVVCAAAWLVGASVFAIAPETNAEGLRSSITQLHTLRTLFVTQALQPTVAQAFAHRQHLLYQRPVVVTTDATTQDPTPPANFTLHDLYTPRPDETPLERAPFTQNEAQDHTAVIYGVFTRNGVDQETSIDMIHLSHNTAISSYDEANLQTQAPSSLLEYRPLPLAYSVLRLHYAYYLHRIVLDIFRRGGSYLVASAFDPAEFVALVHRYQLEHAELTTTEIERLIAYLSAHRADQRQAPPSRSRPGSLRSSSSAEMLGSLRFIYIASTTPELVQDLEELLPHVELVRARYGSYLDPADLHRRM